MILNPILIRLMLTSLCKLRDEDGIFSFFDECDQDSSECVEMEAKRKRILSKDNAKFTDS
jgi:hypothetical protein